MNNTNDMLILGIIILVAGIFVASYSFSTYSEIKSLGTKIDFEELDNNNEMPTSDKYYKYLSYADFLNQKLEKNKSILIKNASCVYLDYAQHNAKFLYLLTQKLDSDESKRSVAAGNIRSLYNMLDNYKTCNQSAGYKTELQKIIDEIQNNNLNPPDTDYRMEKFLNGYDQKAQEEAQPVQTEQEAPVTHGELPPEALLPQENNQVHELPPIEKPDRSNIPPKR